MAKKKLPDDQLGVLMIVRAIPGYVFEDFNMNAAAVMLVSDGCLEPDGDRQYRLVGKGGRILESLLPRQKKDSLPKDTIKVPKTLDKAKDFQEGP